MFVGNISSKTELLLIKKWLSTLKSDSDFWNDKPLVGNVYDRRILLTATEEFKYIAELYR